MNNMKWLKSEFVGEKGELGTATDLAEKSGGSLDPLENPASADKILSGYEAYDDQGEKITGAYDPSLPALTTPAAASDIANGKEAYDDQGEKITGSYTPTTYTDGNEVDY